ncbi:NUDIX domain-containing protein, partial [Mesobacillus foraminis]|uniref:NUDIX hydrolase n=1 Tax=Mesobacillus foraminis TaxID=279826 RepID=UPI0039A3B690
MENEQLKIFDEYRNQMGVATREEVHRLGYWHEAFHCWFISKEQGIDYIYLQLRSKNKKDYPNLLDITAAGHLLANETVQDGIREIKEEIGVDISFHELIPLGIIDYSVKRDDFIDKETANVFLYKSQKSFDDFTLQEEEVAGI